MKASCLDDSSSQILQSSIQHNSLGVPGVPSPVQGPAAIGRDPALKEPTLQRSGEPCRSPLVLLPSHKRTRCWEGNVCNGLHGHGKITGAGSLLQYSVAFLDLASTEDLISCLPSLMLQSESPPSPELLLCFSFMFFFSGTYFSFFTILPPSSFSVLIMEGMFDDTQGPRSAEDGQ